MIRSKISLNAIRTFETCARHLSFKKAAEDLHVTPSAVSYQMRALQEDLGVALFERAGRGLTLTEQGAALATDVKTGIQQIEAGLHRLRSEARLDTLILQAYMSIASKWLLPRLATFRKRHPSQNIELFTSYTEWGFRPEMADAGLVYGTCSQPDIHHWRFFVDSLIVVASPKLLAVHPKLTSPEDLYDLPFISMGDHDDTLGQWFQAFNLPVPLGPEMQRIDTQFVAIEAAIAGQGLLIIPSLFVLSDIDKGLLCRALMHQVKGDRCWSLACSKTRREDVRIRRLAHWLSHEFAYLLETDA